MLSFLFSLAIAADDSTLATTPVAAPKTGVAVANPLLPPEAKQRLYIVMPSFIHPNLFFAVDPSMVTEFTYTQPIEGAAGGMIFTLKIEGERIEAISSRGDKLKGAVLNCAEKNRYSDMGGKDPNTFIVEWDQNPKDPGQMTETDVRSMFLCNSWGWETFTVIPAPTPPTPQP